MTAANPTTQPEQSQAIEPAEQRDGRSISNGEAPKPPINVPPTERLISVAAGGALAITGFKMRSVPGAVLAIIGGAMVHRGYTGHCASYEALGVNRAKGPGAAPNEYFKRGIHVAEAVTINKPAAELYAFWRDFKNLPKFMRYLEAVKVLDDKKSHWTAKAPAGLSVEWDAEIISDEKDELIAWRSLFPASVDNAGSVRFKEGPKGRGTEVRVVLDYIPPAGKAGYWVAKLFGRDPAAEVREDLRYFKHFMETGEAPTTAGQPHGRRGFSGTIMNAAVP